MATITSIDLKSSVKDQAIQAVEIIYEDFQNFPWNLPMAYGNWLAQTHYFVKHATRLLAFAAARCGFGEERLHQLLLQGINEEKGHEVLALNDLKHLGYRIEDLPEMAETKAYHQTLYFAIDHSGPASLIGWFLPLEGVAGSKFGPDLQNLRQLYTSKALSFLRVHCELDTDHFEDGLKVIEQLNTDQLHAVSSGIELSVNLYRTMLKRLKDESTGTTPQICSA